MCFRPLVDIQQFNKLNLVKPLVLDREVVLTIQKQRKGLDQRQLRQLNNSLENICRYLDNQYSRKSLSDLRHDLSMSPNVIQRVIEILKKIGYVVESNSIRKGPKKRRRGLFASSQNLKMIQYYEDVHNLNKQKRQGRTKLDHDVLMGMIRLNETTMSKNQVAKKFGLKSGKNFERLVRKYSSLSRYREEFRALNENKSWIIGSIGPMLVRIPR